MKDPKVVYICSQLYQKLYGKEQQRDIASIALKAVVEAVANPQTAVEVVGMLAPKLIEGIRKEVRQMLADVGVAIAVGVKVPLLIKVHRSVDRVRSYPFARTRPIK